MESLPAPPQHFIDSLHHAQYIKTPYDHWLLNDVLPVDLSEEIVALPITPASIGDTEGKRDTHNSTRIFCDVENRRKFESMEVLAQMFQDADTIRAIEDTCGNDLTGTSLRIEYCQDLDGFWLETHTDLGVKKFTMTIYLCSGEGAEDWGTDIYDADRHHVARAPSPFNSACMFVPATNTYHGFERRPIHGVRKSLIVNYVSPEWRSRNELAFPDQPIS